MALFKKKLPLFLTIAVLFFLGAVGVFKLTFGGFKDNMKVAFEETIDPDATTGTYEGDTVQVPKITSTVPNAKKAVLGVSNLDKWIDVDLSEQKLRAWEGNNLFLESLVSTGLPWFATPTGEFSIWLKVRATRMEGGEGRYYYNLPNVPYVMFFENGEIPGYRGFSLHGTYWHNDFGKVHSHGCVNLPTPIAEQLYYWTSPTVPDGKGTIRASAGNPGTKVVIHN